MSWLDLFSLLFKIFSTGFAVIFAALFTHGIATAWRQSGWLFEQRMMYAKEDYFRKINILSSSFSLVDMRIAASRAYASSIDEGDKFEIDKERENYKKAVSEWHSKIHSLTTEMKSAFGRTTSNDFDENFPPKFSLVNDRLGLARRNFATNPTISKNALQEAEKIIVSINADARNLSSRLYSRTEEGKRYIDQNPKIRYENIDYLSYPYLLKSLFQRRTDF